MQVRKQLLTDLTQAIAAHSREHCLQLCFKILYGLPAEIQIELACFVVRRYLPIFETHWPDVAWPRQLLNNPEQGFEEIGWEIPVEPQEVGPADATFLSSIDGLQLACSSQADPGRLASSCTYAIDTGIQARANNVWMADDPPAVSMWSQLASANDMDDMEQLLKEFEGRSVTRNVASLAVRTREWKLVAEWLSAKEIWTHPDSTDTKQKEQYLTEWKTREFLLMPELE
jgi:hypothetical protein